MDGMCYEGMPTFRKPKCDYGSALTSCINDVPTVRGINQILSL